MIFTSTLFILFFTASAIAYWALPHRFRWILILGISLFFYAVVIPAYTLVLLITVLINFGFGLGLGQNPVAKRRKFILLCGVIINIFILAGFKYFNSISELIFRIHHGAQQPYSTLVRIVVPLGISFYTFTNIGYLIEVYREKISPEKHLGYFACFIAFFPKLLQGPIERPQSFLQQIRQAREFNPEQVTSGLRLILWGFFKKMVIADRLAISVNAIYDHPQNSSGPAIVVATLFFYLQIYADFSGYIDIARGAAKMLGFELALNFDRPYAAKSIQDFWMRWHITLSSWLRDYIFFPFAFSLSRKMKAATYVGIRTETLIYSIAITLTFFICGIWHGVGWHYIVWGTLFGFYLTVARFTVKIRKRFYRLIGLTKFRTFYKACQLITTFILVSFAWLFFRSSSMTEAVALIRQIPSGWWQWTSTKMSIAVFISIWFAVCIPMLLFLEYILAHSKFRKKIFNMPLMIRWLGYYIVLALVFLSWEFAGQTFLYFQF